MEGSLFRPEVQEFRQQTAWGSVRTATPVSQSMGTLAALLIGLALILWMWLGHYTRRAHVTGILVPQAGIINVDAQNNGVVTRVLVQEGMDVQKGSPVVIVSGERSTESAGDSSAKTIASLKQQKDKLNIDIVNAQSVAIDQKEGFRKQINDLQGQIEQIDSQLDLQRKSVSSQLEILRKMRSLLGRGYISELQMEQQEVQELDAAEQVRSLERQRYDTSEQLDGANRQLHQLPMDSQAKIDDLQRQIAQIDQSIIQNESLRSIVLRASQAGAVSSVLIKDGQSVSDHQTLLSIVPIASPLQAELLVPSGAIGFVKRGTQVQLHYQAYPYQNFGIYQGRVASVSENALNEVEVASLLGGVPSSTEPLYRVLVTLDQQIVPAYGRSFSLKPGMSLDADLLLDRRRIFEWIFEPLYSMGQRVEATE